MSVKLSSECTDSLILCFDLIMLSEVIKKILLQKMRATGPSGGEALLYKGSARMMLQWKLSYCLQVDTFHSRK